MALGGQLGIIGPAYIASSIADLYTPPNAAVYRVIKKIHIQNVTAGAVTFSMYKGATGGSAGGTELWKDYSIAANKDFERFMNMKMISTAFLSAVASSGSALVVTIEYEDVAS